MRDAVGGHAPLGRGQSCTGLAGARAEDTHLLVGKPSFAVKVVLEEGNVGLGLGLVRVELFVGWLEESGGLHLFDYALGGAKRLSIVGYMHGKVDGGRQDSASLTDLRDGRLCLCSLA